MINRLWLYRLGNEHHARTVALILFSIALTARLAALFILPEAHLSGNAKESILAGADLIRNGQFINNPDYPMLIPPLVAIFTAALQTLFGDSLLPVKLAQVALDACLIVLVFYIGKWTVGQIPAALGAGLLTVYPFAVFVPLYIGTEALFGFLLALSILAIAKAFRDDAIRLFFASGSILGLATLARGTTLFLPIILVGFIVWYYHKQPESRVVPKCVTLILGFVLVLSPWIARNLIVHNAFIPSSTSSGPLLHGSSEDFWLISDRERLLPQYYKYLKDEKGISAPINPSWVEKDKYYRQAALENYKDRWNSDPVSFIPFLAKKFVRLWYATESGANVAVVALINLPIYIFAIFGLYLLILRRDRLATLLIVLLAYFVAIHMAVFAYFRYIVPVMPYVLLLAAYGGAHLIQRHSTAEEH